MPADDTRQQPAARGGRGGSGGAVHGHVAATRAAAVATAAATCRCRFRCCRRRRRPFWRASPVLPVTAAASGRHLKGGGAHPVGAPPALHGEPSSLPLGSGSNDKDGGPTSAATATSAIIIATIPTLPFHQGGRRIQPALRVGGQPQPPHASRARRGGGAGGGGGGGPPGGRDRGRRRHRPRCSRFGCWSAGPVAAWRETCNGPVVDERWGRRQQQGRRRRS